MQIGQHIQCLESGNDMVVPGKVKWCKVMNFVHADGRMATQRKLTYTRPDNTAGSITLAETHLVHRLVDAPNRPFTASSADQCELRP